MVVSNQTYVLRKELFDIAVNAVGNRDDRVKDRIQYEIQEQHGVNLLVEWGIGVSDGVRRDDGRPERSSRAANYYSTKAKTGKPRLKSI